MKAGKNDKKAHLHFTSEELDFLQDNTWQMAESFGLDKRMLLTLRIRKLLSIESVFCY